MPDQSQSNDPNQPTPIITGDEYASAPSPTPTTPPLGAAAPANDIQTPGVVPTDDTGQAPPGTTPPSFDLPPVITPITPKKKFGGGKVIATILGILFLIGSVGAGLLLVQQRQEIRTKAWGCGCPEGATCECIPSPECHEQGTQLCRVTGDGGGDGGGGDGGGGGGGGGGVDCNACGGFNRGTCTGSDFATCNKPSCNAGLSECGGGCYPSGWRQCPGQAGCRDPGIECAGADQCAGVSCPSGQHCNGGTCVADDTGTGGGTLTYKKFICPQGCGSDGQCRGEDQGASISDVSSSTILSSGDCGQIDVYTNGVYSQVKQNTCGSDACSLGGGGDGGGGSSAAQCLNIQTFDTDWVKITDLSTLKAGNVVRFTVAGTTPSGSFTKARFKINGVQRPEVTGKRPGTDEFYDEYTIPAGTSSFSINAELYHSSLGWF